MGEHNMNRREAFRLMTAGALMPAFSPGLVSLLQQAQPAAGYTLRTLSPGQNEVVVAMIDLIIPATTTPGAKEARVNEFMDLILTDWATPEERDNFLTGLNGVDTQSENLFGKKFLHSSAEQQTALLRVLDDTVDWHREILPHHGSVPAKDRETQLHGEFFRVFKTMTLHGYYTSEIGFTKELQLEIIPGAQHGCTNLPVRKDA
jgi:hypothetical protein